MKPPPSAMNDLYQKGAGLRTGERLPTAMVSVRAAKFPPKGTAADQIGGINLNYIDRKDSFSLRKENSN